MSQTISKVEKSRLQESEKNCLRLLEYGLTEFAESSPPVSEASTAPISMELTTIS